MQNIKKIRELDDFSRVNQKLREGWILLCVGIVGDAEYRMTRYVVGTTDEKAE